jgi:hypothetical protein
MAVLETMLCGTKQAELLLLPRVSNAAVKSQQYCCPEAAIRKQVSLYRKGRHLVPVTVVFCTTIF